MITVQGIDRDELKQEIFFFTIRATELNEPFYYTEQNVTFIVNDLNDNKPVITEPKSHILTLTIPEALITDINDTITINDIDSVSFLTSRFYISVKFKTTKFI